MRSTLEELLAAGRVLLADGATGTNYFAAGLEAGEPPEFWNEQHPERVAALHQAFVDAGSDIVLTNTFGCNPHRLKLHGAQERAGEIAATAARIARGVADASERPVVVAGSVGPTGELFEPMGALTHEAAVRSFAVQIAGLREGGADVVWIETMSSAEEVHAAASAAVAEGMPWVATCSFDTAGRTMMGILPSQLPAIVATEPVAPLAIGANCGVGAPDILVSVLEMAGSSVPVVCKGNCGVPQFVGTEIVYSGTPDLMARYAVLAADAGARIVGGCCGTTPAHLAAMRSALDARVPGARPELDRIVAEVGPLTNSMPGAAGHGGERRGRRARPSGE